MKEDILDLRRKDKKSLFALSSKCTQKQKREHFVELVELSWGLCNSDIGIKNVAVGVIREGR